MNPELRELYQSVILDHGKKPRNFRTVAEPTHHADGHNPLCGDKVHLKLVVRQGRRVVDAIAFRQPPVDGARRLRLVYRLSENTWGDRPTVQLVVEHLSALA